MWRSILLCLILFGCGEAPSKEQILASCQLAAHEDMNFIRACMKAHDYAFTEDGSECEAFLKKNPAFIGYMRQYDDAKTEAERREADINIARTVIAVENLQKTRPECYY
jgi:hypothetical protein